ncbi:MAG TPA: molybdenum cofactor guanylyltransferase [Candidatus Cybelea sp.]|nr:molybdenum cofactor guanylyltransferase [Candidatus Cybelea sp.]
MREAIVLLAGGRSRRFPGKLEREAGGGAMILRVFEHLRPFESPIYVAGKSSFSPQVDARLEAPLLIDRMPARGPLSAFLGACATIRADRLFAIAADQPALESRVLDELCAAWEAGDEAVVPEHDGRLEPLAALYDRYAVLRESIGLRRRGCMAMRDLLGRLAVRTLPADGRYFVNVNRPGDLAAVTA